MFGRGKGVTMDRLSRALVRVLRDAREMLQQPGNDFLWSSWPDAEAASRELDDLIGRLEAGKMPPREELSILFAPTGPIQEVSLSSGWGEAFLALAARFDAAWAAPEVRPPRPGAVPHPKPVTKPPASAPPEPSPPGGGAAPSIPGASASTEAQDCWRALVARFGAPIAARDLPPGEWPGAVAERRALRVDTWRDGFGGGNLHFRRAQAEDPAEGNTYGHFWICVIFPRPCELSDQEIGKLGNNPWEHWGEVCSFTSTILGERGASPGTTPADGP
jgi:hypothetical protein